MSRKWSVMEKSLGTQCSGECYSKTTSNTNRSYCGQTIQQSPTLIAREEKNLQSCA